jgi:hypothetical protein
VASEFKEEREHGRNGFLRGNEVYTSNAVGRNRWFHAFFV